MHTYLCWSIVPFLYQIATHTSASLSVAKLFDISTKFTFKWNVDQWLKISSEYVPLNYKYSEYIACKFCSGVCNYRNDDTRKIYRSHIQSSF